MASRKRYRLLSWSVYGALFLVALVFVALSLTLPKATAIALFDFNHYNGFFFFIRYTLYAVLYFQWNRIARYFNPDVSDIVLRSTRRSVGILIVVYEVVLGINIFNFI